MADNSNKTPSAEQVVTPVALAKELTKRQGKLMRPQVIFGWIRKETIPSHKCVCGHTYLMRDEVEKFLADREAKEAAKVAKAEAELEGETAEAVSA